MTVDAHPELPPVWSVAPLSSPARGLVPAPSLADVLDGPTDDAGATAAGRRHCRMRRALTRYGGAAAVAAGGLGCAAAGAVLGGLGSAAPISPAAVHSFLDAPSLGRTGLPSLPSGVPGAPSLPSGIPALAGLPAFGDLSGFPGLPGLPGFPAPGGSFSLLGNVTGSGGSVSGNGSGGGATASGGGTVTTTSPTGSTLPSGGAGSGAAHDGSMPDG